MEVIIYNLEDKEMARESLRKIGEMIAGGYNQGIGNPYGLNWEIKEE